MKKAPPVLDYRGDTTMTTANKITILRILLAPFFVVELLYYLRSSHEWHRVLAMTTFGLAAGLD